MFNYLPLQWMLLFYFYSFCGWIWESLYVSVLEKRLVNRGFMRGPFLPLYGCGGVMMLVASRPFYDSIILVYIAGCIGATLLELITGIVMETLFNVRYWDYHHKKFNFMGYTCLESTLFWGVCTVAFSHRKGASGNSLQDTQHCDHSTYYLHQLRLYGGLQDSPGSS